MTYLTHDENGKVIMKDDGCFKDLAKSENDASEQFSNLNTELHLKNIKTILKSEMRELLFWRIFNPTITGLTVWYAFSNGFIDGCIMSMIFAFLHLCLKINDAFEDMNNA